jgi:hypothetical protein
MYPRELLECFKSIMETGGNIGKLFDDFKVNDTSWPECLRREAQSLKKHANTGLGLQPPAIFKHIHHEADRVLRHYARAGELMGQACDAINTREGSLPVILSQANKELSDGNKKVRRVVSEASKFLRGERGYKTV